MPEKNKVKEAVPPTREKLESLARESNTLKRLYKTGKALLGLQAGSLNRIKGLGTTTLQRTIPLPFEPGTSIFIRAYSFNKRAFFHDPNHIVCGTIDNSGGENSIALELGQLESANPADPFDLHIASRFDNFVTYVLEQMKPGEA